MAGRLLAHVHVVLFDYGNTLAHLDHAFIAATLGEHGHTVTPHAVHEADHAAKRWVDRLVAARRAGSDCDRRLSYFGMILETLGVDAARADLVTRKLDAAHAAECLWRVVAEDTASVLDRLRARGYRLGIISNADGRVSGDLDRNGLAAHFVGVEKPDPRIFALALQRMGARAEEAMYVGDVHSIDIDGAERAGLIGALLDPLGLYDDVPCLHIGTLADLLDLLPGASG